MMSQVLLMAKTSQVSFPSGRLIFGAGLACGLFDMVYSVFSN